MWVCISLFFVLSLSFYILKVNNAIVCSMYYRQLKNLFKRNVVKIIKTITVQDNPLEMRQLWAGLFLYTFLLGLAFGWYKRRNKRLRGRFMSQIVQKLLQWGSFYIFWPLEMKNNFILISF